MLILLEALPGNGVHVARSHLGRSSQDNHSLLVPAAAVRGDQPAHSHHVPPLTGLIKTNVPELHTDGPVGGAEWREELVLL